MKKVVQWVLILGIVGFLGAAAGVTVFDMKAVGEHRAVIAGEFEKIAGYQEELTAQEDTIQVLGDRMAALSRAERAAKIGEIARRSQEIVKRGNQLNGLARRAERRIENREEKISTRIARMVRLDLMFAGGIVLMAVGLVVLGRFGTR